MLRWLACLLLAALLLATPAAAKRHPPVRGKVPGVSSIGLPYVAPWQSDFERHSTQILNPDQTASNAETLTVPDGQWWRIVMWTASYSTVATAGTRVLQLQATVPGAGILLFGAPGTQGPSVTYTYVFAPGASAYNTAGGVTSYMQTSLPDLLWPPGTQFQMSLSGAQVGDARYLFHKAAVEIYVPIKAAARAAALVPIPLVG